MKTNETPRTDAVANETTTGIHAAMLNHARQLERENAALVAALRAIEARIHGAYDDPLLLAYGPLGTLSGDCSHIARAALAQVRK